MPPQTRGRPADPRWRLGRFSGLRRTAWSLEMLVSLGSGQRRLRPGHSHGLALYSSAKLFYLFSSGRKTSLHQELEWGQGLPATARSLGTREAATGKWKLWLPVRLCDNQSDSPAAHLATGLNSTACGTERSH